VLFEFGYQSSFVSRGSGLFAVLMPPAIERAAR
jgi:hypothetical protein